MATVTYLTEGSILHRDTLGSEQPIRPGDVNWMIAGRGIAHSERSDATERQIERGMEGIQSWVALPRAHEETAPGFFHHPGATLPHLTDTGVTVTVIAGTAYGQTAPVTVLSQTLYADVTLSEGPHCRCRTSTRSARPMCSVARSRLAGRYLVARLLLVFRPGDAITIRARAASRVLLVGGEPMDGPRHVWWNFVSSDLARIEQAKDDWRSGRFGVVPGDESEFIPLP